MPARTLLAAAAGAASGIFATALFYNLRAPPPQPAPVVTVHGGTSSQQRTALPPHFPPPAPKKPEETLIVDPAGLFQYGFPGPVNDLGIHKAFISGYDRRTRNPAWVTEHITPESIAIRDGDRKNSQFVEDEAVPEKFRAKLKDYFRSGFDRGHQVPAADAGWNQSAMDETFLLTNMCPQVGNGFNRDYWSHFEDFCRRLTKKYPSVRIVTGPLYLPNLSPDGKWRVEYEVIGNPPNVAVPTHFYKVIFAEESKDGKSGKVAVGAFVLPNDRISNSKKLKEFEVPVEIVERASGLEFVSKLEPSRRKELCREVECSIIVREFKKTAEELKRK